MTVAQDWNLDMRTFADHQEAVRLWVEQNPVVASAVRQYLILKVTMEIERRAGA